MSNQLRGMLGTTLRAGLPELLVLAAAVHQVKRCPVGRVKAFSEPCGQGPATWPPRLCRAFLHLSADAGSSRRTEWVVMAEVGFDWVQSLTVVSLLRRP